MAALKKKGPGGRPGALAGAQQPGRKAPKLQAAAGPKLCAAHKPVVRGPVIERARPYYGVAYHIVPCDQVGVGRPYLAPHILGHV